MAWAWERGEKLLMLPDQHLGRNTAFRMGVPLDEMVVWDPDLPFGGVERDAPRPRAPDSVEGPLQRSHAVLGPPHRAVPPGESRRQGHRAPRVHVRRRPGGRRLRIDRAHHPHGEDQPRGIGLGRRDGDPSREPPRARGRAGAHGVARSTRWAACARRCSACRRTICSGCSTVSWTARSTTASSCPSRRRHGRASPCIECWKLT